MIITIKEARNLIGKEHSKYTDEEIEEILYTFSALSDMAIDSWLAKTPEERKQFSQQLSKKNKNTKKASK